LSFGVDLLMSLDNELFEDELFDPIIESGTGSERKSSAPRIEQDLAKLGSLEAISAQKKAVEEKNRRMTEAQTDAGPEPESAPPAHEEEYVYGAGQTVSVVNEEEPDRDFGDISASSIALGDINFADASAAGSGNGAASAPLMSQSKFKDMSENISAPELSDMAEQYAPTKARAEDLIAKERLAPDEKQLLKERLKNEIGVRPEGYDQKASLVMYKSLMAERRLETAKKGLMLNLLLVVLGMTCAYFIIAQIAKDSPSQFIQYLGVGVAFFSLVLCAKARIAKIIASVYFALSTGLIIFEGVSKYIINGKITEIEVLPLVFRVAAIFLCAFISIQLLTNKAVKIYFATNFSQEKKKIVGGNMAKSS